MFQVVRTVHHVANGGVPAPFTQVTGTYFQSSVAEREMKRLQEGLSSFDGVAERITYYIHVV